MAAIPDPSDASYYRFALGAVFALGQMVRTTDDPAAIRENLTVEDIQTLVDLTSHPDTTMRDWATTTVAGLQDERSVNPLIAALADETASPYGRSNAALALRESAAGFDAGVREGIVAAVGPLDDGLDPATARLLEELAGDDAARPDRTGCVSRLALWDRLERAPLLVGRRQGSSRIRQRDRSHG
jgi:hypothetical protein